jgi:hypothetical protein
MPIRNLHREMDDWRSSKTLVVSYINPHKIAQSTTLGQKERSDE